MGTTVLRRFSLAIGLFYLFVLVVSLFSSAQICSAQQLKEMIGSKRTWIGSNGKKIEATLISANISTFKLNVGGKEIEMPYDKLEPGQAMGLKVAYLDHVDFMQFENVKDKLSSIQDRSRTVADLLIQVQRDYPDSPYAGLWGTVALSAGLNDLEKAEKLARSTIKCIEAQREIVADRHQTTLCSAFNNLAVLQLKAKKGDTAGASFLRAISSVNQIPFVTNHNIQQLLEITDREKTVVTLSDKTRRSLNVKVASMQAAAPGSVMSDGWHYSLDFDVPKDSVAAHKVDGVDPPIAGMELNAIGTGFVVAPGIVLTSHAFIRDLDGTSNKFLTVSAKNVEENLTSYRVQSVYTPSIQIRATSGTSVDLGNRTVQFTNFEIIHPKSGTAGAEICALQVPGLPTKHVVFDSNNAPAESEVTVLGFHRSSDALERGVQKWTGIIPAPRKMTARFPKGTQELSVNVEGGARGGPVMRSDGAVIGMAYNSIADDSTSTGLLFPVSTIRTWFGEFVKTNDLTYVKPVDAGTNWADVTENATVPIFAWEFPVRSDTKVFSRFVDASQIGGMALVDTWCIGCNGKGYVKCSNPNCRNGVVVGKEMKNQGTTPLGHTVYSDSITREKCSTCRGVGKQDCPFCEEGHLQWKRAKR